MGHILVGMDLKGRLVESMVIGRGNEKFYRTIYYVGNPFKCGCCHIYGHLVSNCTYPNKRKFWTKKTMSLSKNKMMKVAQANRVMVSMMEKNGPVFSK
jgi:hypothetical protein